MTGEQTPDAYGCFQTCFAPARVMSIRVIAYWLYSEVITIEFFRTAGVAMLFAKSLTFQEEWVVDNRRVTMRAVSGEPAGKVNLILSLHGDSSIQKIVEVTADRMILVEEPSGTRFEWRRVPVVETTALPGVSPDSSGR